MRTLIVFLGVILGATAAPARVPRSVCRDACSPAITQCASAGHARRCRRQIVRTCRREGLETCVTTTTTSSTSTTGTAPEVTTTTITGASTTTTTLQSGYLGQWLLITTLADERDCVNMPPGIVDDLTITRAGDIFTVTGDELGTLTGHLHVLNNGTDGLIARGDIPWGTQPGSTRGIDFSAELLRPDLALVYLDVGFTTPTAHCYSTYTGTMSR